MSGLLRGWPLAGFLGVTLVGGALAIVAAHGGDVDGVRLVVRITARTSLLLFALAFTASAMVTLWPGTLTRWQRANRRQLGVSFAISHLVHGLALLGLAWLDHQLFRSLTNPVSLVTGAIAYAFILAMAATSIDGAAARLGPRAWRTLHIAGAWYIWISFAVAYGKRLPITPFYWPFFAVVIAMLAVRLAARYTARRRLAAR
ncbi:MAG: ferric reductase-like transmembrane domain-containing protein [Alphaproteobacteria bacterium]|nr:ferric reductase-like transmembrane domain-containing protein [Alphaproteobacteria bacterium]MCW5740084.1 ferric reductase-like transmembrane domain-containing protein [Alphaproteobacteria bacterium]